jgi:hypothetical protein
MVALRSVSVVERPVREVAAEFIPSNPEIAACCGFQVDGVVPIGGIDNPPVRPVWACDPVAALELVEHTHGNTSLQFRYDHATTTVSPE